MHIVHEVEMNMTPSLIEKQANKILWLESEIKELELVNDCIKIENKDLKVNFTYLHLQSDKEKLKIQKKLFIRKARKWYIHSWKRTIKIIRLKLKLSEARRKEHDLSSGLIILIDDPKRL